MNNIQLITTEIVDLYADFFNKEYYVNFFSRKNVYISKNFEDREIRVNTKVGDLGGVPVNSWEEESEQANLFIISKIDYENLKQGIYSKEVLFISGLLTRKQTKVDEKQGILTSKIIIVKETDFLKYLDLRLTLIGKDLKMLDTDQLRRDLFQIIYPNLSNNIS